MEMVGVLVATVIPVLLVGVAVAIVIEEGVNTNLGRSCSVGK